MKKTKIVIPMLLAIGTLVGCGPSSNTTITIWVADNITELTEKQVQRFKDETGMPFSFRIEAVGEGSAASNMITDVQNGADIYGFAQDQTARLLAAGALSALPSADLNDHTKGGIAEEVYKRSDAVSQNAMSHYNAAGETDFYCAYPMTSDNGYFMYYDKRVFKNESDVATLEGIYDALEKYNQDNPKDKRTFGTEINWWYQAGYFFSRKVTEEGGETKYGEPLCKSEWQMDENGSFISYEDNFNSENGKIACSVINKIFKEKSAVHNNSCKTDSFNASSNKSALVISGMWDYKTASEALGENLATAKLPTFKYGEDTYQMGSFAGGKLLGVKPLENTSKSLWCAKLASYLTDEKCALERFKEVSWGPANLKAQEDPEVKANPGLNTLNAQNKYAIAQGSYPSQWWDAGKEMVSAIKENGNIDKALKDYAEKIKNGLTN